MFKLKCLFKGLLLAYYDWKENVKDVDLDSPHCCGGGSIYDPCGCEGITNRTYLEWVYFNGK